MVKLYIDKRTGKAHTAMQLRALYKAEKITYESSPDYINQPDPFPSIFKFKLDNFIFEDKDPNLRILCRLLYNNKQSLFRALVVDIRNCTIVNKLAGNKQFIYDSFDTIIDTHPDAEWLELVHECKNNCWLNFDKYFKGYKNVTC